MRHREVVRVEMRVEVGVTRQRWDGDGHGSGVATEKWANKRDAHKVRFLGYGDGLTWDGRKRNAWKMTWFEQQGQCDLLSSEHFRGSSLTEEGESG